MKVHSSTLLKICLLALAVCTVMTFASCEIGANHTWTYFETTVRVKCDEDICSISRCYCKECRNSPLGYGEKITVVEEGTQHVYDNENVKHASQSCEHEGYDYIVCTVCGDIHIIESTRLPALGHDLHTEVTPATCEEKGCIHEYCSICDYTEDRPIPTLPHTYTSKEMHKHTQTEVGYYTEVCDVCGYEHTVYDDSIEHDYKLAETHVATCQQGGYEIYVCSVCGHQDSPRVISEPDENNHHLAINEELSKDATCTESGYEYYYCDIEGCTHTEKHYTTSPLGHSFTEQVNVVDATCTEKGYTTMKCSRCEETKNTDFTDTDADNHNYIVTNTVHATCVDDGDITETCTRCGNEKHTAITEHADHDYAIVSEISPTYSKAGKTTERCKVCGDEKVTVSDIIDYPYYHDDACHYDEYGQCHDHDYDANEICNVCGHVRSITAGLGYLLDQEAGTYTVMHGTATGELIIIPETYNGKDVVSISAGAFKNDANITKIIIRGNNITDKEIFKSAFEGCENITTIVIDGIEYDYQEYIEDEQD